MCVRPRHGHAIARRRAGRSSPTCASKDETITTEGARTVKIVKDHTMTISGAEPLAERPADVMCLSSVAERAHRDMIRGAGRCTGTRIPRNTRHATCRTSPRRSAPSRQDDRAPGGMPMLQELIIRDPAICAGQPTFKGTRVLLRTVLGYLSRGESTQGDSHGLSQPDRFPFVTEKIGELPKRNYALIVDEAPLVAVGRGGARPMESPSHSTCIQCARRSRKDSSSTFSSTTRPTRRTTGS